MTFRALLLTVLIVVLSAPAMAEAGTTWATVNTCAPNVVGMRASVPGDGTTKQQFVRFSAQWWSHLKQDWLPIGGAPDSPWLPAGTSESVSSQAGWNYAVEPPPPGAVFLIRGIAQIQWRHGGQVVRSTARVTRADAPGLLEGAPRGSCTLG